MSDFLETNLDRFSAIEALFQISPIMPTVELLDEFDAVPLCDALLQGGAKTIQINIRTEASYESISIIKKRCPEIIVGAGNVRTPDILKNAIDAGAEFASSPGNTDKLLNAVESHNFPFIPGVNGGSDMMRALEHGHIRQKLCPVISIGGVKALKFYQGEFFDIKFTVSGGLNDDNVGEYIILPNVECVIGSWIVRAHDTYNKKWNKVIERTQFSFENINNRLKHNDCSDDEAAA